MGLIGYVCGAFQVTLYTVQSTSKTEVQDYHGAMSLPGEVGEIGREGHALPPVYVHGRCD